MFIKKTKGEVGHIPLDGIMEPSDVMLVVSPLTEINVPLYPLHLLQASCRDAGINTSIFYSNIIYSNLIGQGLHKVISVDYHLLLGEQIFAVAAFNLPSASITRRTHKFSDPAWMPDHVWQVKDPKVPEPAATFRKWLDTVDLEYLESLTTDWVRAFARQIVNIGFRIVGCSTTLGGLVPAVALLNCIKKADPGVITIIGGALCEAEMAEGILSLNTNIDYIFSGEGEITFPALVKQILRGHLPEKKIIYGEEVIDLDTTPLPDYHDYLKQKEKLNLHWSPGKNKHVLPFETSRGCWHGKCTFCGLNGKKNLYREKSPDKVIQTIKALVERHGMNILIMNDTMMPAQHFDTLIPRLSFEIPAIKIIYEVGADLTLDQVLSLKNTCFMLKTGIESLSPSLLKRIHKPYTVRKNIALLRYARSAGIKVIWSLLFGTPGDQTNEYEEMLHLIPLLRHLQPPNEMYPLVLFRFSKYQRSPEMFGITNLRPAGIFKETFPSHADVDKATYYFTADFPSQSRENPAIITALWEAIQEWRSAWDAYNAIPLDIMLPNLQVIRKTTDRYILEDTRGLPGGKKRIEIGREEASLLLVARPLEAAPEIKVRWAVEAGLGVIMESWFIPLASAEPSLLKEFERDYKKSV